VGRKGREPYGDISNILGRLQEKGGKKKRRLSTWTGGPGGGGEKPSFASHESGAWSGGRREEGGDPCPCAARPRRSGKEATIVPRAVSPSKKTPTPVLPKNPSSVLLTSGCGGIEEKKGGGGKRGADGAEAGEEKEPGTGVLYHPEKKGTRKRAINYFG